MIVQVLIAVLGVGAVWLSQDERPHLRKYACIFGLLGQPLWFYTSWSTEQWGIFALSFVYTIAWLKGLHVYWLSGVPSHSAPAKGKDSTR